ncbi:MAG: hypothetical protein ACK4E8_04475 [Lacibacter sp.]
MAIWKGAIPYKDFFDHKPPLIFLLMALAWPLKHWGIFILGALAKWIAACFIYRTARHMEVPYPWAFPIMFLILLLTPSILMEGVLTREYAACFLALLYAHLFSKRRDAFFTAGLLAALVFYTQQEELLPAIPLLVWYWLQAPPLTGKTLWQSRWEQAVQLVSGFLMFSLPIFIWFTLQNALYAFWHESISFNLFIYGSDASLENKVSSLLFVLFHTRYLFLLLPLLGLHFWFAILNQRRSLHLAFVGSLIIFFIIKTTLGRIVDKQAFYHYMLPLSATVSFSLIVLTQEFRSLIRFFKPWVVIGILSVTFIVFWKNSASRLVALFKQRKPHPAELLKTELIHLKNQDRQLYVMGLTKYIYLYNELNILSPSPWTYVSQYSQRLPFDPNAEVIDDIINSLEKYQTQWIVDYLLIRPLPQQLHQQKWESYLLKNFDEVKRTENYILFKRKPHAIP